MAKPKIPLANRFWNKVNKTLGQGPQGTCWQWTACTDGFGYGAISGRPAHRVSWEIHNGPIPQGMCVCHKCDNPPCVNPQHLFVGTKKDNAMDMGRKRRNYTPPLWTEIRAKLTHDQVLAIRQRYAYGKARELGVEYGIHPATVRNIAARKRWKHIQ